jgi:3-methyladenine DNA glycosylase AlkD
MLPVINKIRSELKARADEKVRIQGEKYFREDVRIHGLKSAAVTEIASSFYSKLEDKSKENVFKLCEELWKSGYMEESFIACNWSYRVRKQYTEGDFRLFEKWVMNYITNWAACDTFCNHTVGTFIELYPEYLKKLKTWTKSSNRWVKRAAAVSLIVPARKGRFLPDILEIATALLYDNDDMVQKGYGWLLKVASGPHEKEVFDFVMKYKSGMPRTALRYAIEKMPAGLKSQAMAR